MKYIYSIVVVLSFSILLDAAVYLSNPEVASGGNGGKESPWPALEKCISEGHLQKLKPGDTLYLLNGYHGSCSFSGVNQDMITIAAAPGHEARLSRLSLNNADKWHIKNLRISVTFGSPYSGGMVGVDGGMNIVEGCEVFGIDDHKGMDVAAWKAINSGVFIGRNSKGSIVRNCYIRNTRFALGMDGYDSIAEGNVIENFSADGIRMTRDGQIARHNVIKGAFASMGEGDKNHDDAIQCFLFNKGTGTMRNLTINHNYIMGFLGGEEPCATTNQGIGLFDGPLIDFHIEGNVVMVGQWHGVAVYDGQNCSIINNVVWTDSNAKSQAWIMLGTKLKQAKDNTVKDNYASRFKLGQPGTIESNNQVVTKEISAKAKSDLAGEICEIYTPYHRVAKRNRITGEIVKDIPDENEQVSNGSQKSKQGEKAKHKEKTESAAKLSIKEDQVPQFNQQLQSRLDKYLLDKDRSPRFNYSVFKQEVAVAEKLGNAYRVSVPKLGSEMTIDFFKSIKPLDALGLCQAIADKDSDADNALLAFYYFANNDSGNGNLHLRKAGSHKDAVLAALVEAE